MSLDTTSTSPNKKEHALESLRETGGVVVALSGGVDSAVLLALAIEALGAERVLAVTGRSASVSVEDLEDARRVARTLGATHEIVDTAEMDRPGYRANEGDRCYHCRSEVFDSIRGIARQRGFPAVAYGAIREDLGDFRPGMAAAGEHGAIAPLLDAGLTKEEVRSLAAEAGLPVRGKPASACLASRIPVGTQVTEERLLQVGRAEAALRRLGMRQVRVRYHGEVARLELDPEGERLVADPAVRARAVRAVREAGFRFVALDLEGYRSGSLNPDPGVVPLHRIGPAREGGQ